MIVIERADLYENVGIVSLPARFPVEIKLTGSGPVDDQRDPLRPTEQQLFGRFSSNGNHLHN